MPTYRFEDTFVVTYKIEAPDRDTARELASMHSPELSEGEWLDTELLEDDSAGEESPK